MTGEHLGDERLQEVTLGRLERRLLDQLAALLPELQAAIRSEPGNLEYSVHPAAQGDGFRFASPEAFRAHAAAIAELDGPRRLADLVEGPLTAPRLFDAA